MRLMIFCKEKVPTKVPTKRKVSLFLLSLGLCAPSDGQRTAATLHSRCRCVAGSVAGVGLANGVGKASALSRRVTQRHVGCSGCRAKPIPSRFTWSTPPRCCLSLRTLRTYCLVRGQGRRNSFRNSLPPAGRSSGKRPGKAFRNPARILRSAHTWPASAPVSSSPMRSVRAASAGRQGVGLRALQQRQPSFTSNVGFRPVALW